MQKSRLTLSDLATKYALPNTLAASFSPQNLSRRGSSVKSLIEYSEPSDRLAEARTTNTLRQPGDKFSKPSPLGKPISNAQPPRWDNSILRQVSQRTSRSPLTRPSTKSSADLSAVLANGVQEALNSSDPEALRDLFEIARREHGHDGPWMIFGLLQRYGQSRILAHGNAESILDDILSSALPFGTRLLSVFDVAHELLIRHHFHWPNLYPKVMHYMLENNLLDESIRWHVHLTPLFPPTTHVFGTLLSSFVVNPSPRMQSNLTALYVACPNRHLYDHIIPILFAAGLSKLARAWRKKLLVFQDFPTSAKCQPFLRFLAQYYPSIPLTEAELAIAGIDGEAMRSRYQENGATSDRGRGQYSDSVVARWFASSWTSTEFAISLAQRLGLRVIGPRSLQSLALREKSAKSFLICIDQIEKFGLEISPQTYCQALIFFARHGEEALLADLVASDIHPDEFNDIERRQMLMATSVRQGDWRSEKLLQGVEWAVESQSSACCLNAVLSQQLTRHRLGTAKEVLDRMEASKVNMDQRSVAPLLQSIFQGLGKHSANRRQYGDGRRKYEFVLDRAIDMTRRITIHDVAIPLRYWKVLLWNLGRSGRLHELDQMCEEIVQFYAPQLGGLVPIHFEDLPLPPLEFRRPIRERARVAANEKRSICGVAATTPCSHNNANDHRGSAQHHTTYLSQEQSDNTNVVLSPHRDYFLCHIPADLPFTHRQHPLQRIFDPALQRSILRWGFDQTLSSAPSSMSTATQSNISEIAAFDLACGVKLLARLRDKGILIDIQIVRSTISSRIALGRMPGRPRDKSRDEHELSLEHMKALVDEAWGSDVFSDPLEMKIHVEKQQSKLPQRYPNLFT